MTNTTIGILAHADAGKTTLSESILYLSGAIRSRGRVDHGNAFLDTDAMEKKRGITIYSSLARFTLDGRPFTILDTPGHADFSPEMERALRVLDAAVLVVSAADLVSQRGADPQVMLLWRLLAHYNVPTVLFVNKMDQQRDKGTEESLLREQLGELLTESLGAGLVPFDERQLCADNAEAATVCDEALMERVLEGGTVTDEDAAELVAARKLFPVYYGAALHDEGIAALLEGVRRYIRPCISPTEQAPFGALVYKITREGGTRLTWMKITSGTLSIRDSILQTVAPSAPVRAVPSGAGRSAGAVSAEKEPPRPSDGWFDDSDFAGEESEETAGESSAAAERVQEKISELRLYSGNRFAAVTSVSAGEIVAAAGLSQTRAGDGLGIMTANREELLTPVMTSTVTAEDLYGRPVDVFTLMKALRGLEEQEPMLQPSQNEETGDISVRIMGKMQTEILQEQLREKYALRAQFGPGTIVYRETIRRPVEGVGHFEPLRHYAEVHVVLEPGEPGSGLSYEDRCPPDTLGRNWRSLIMTNLREKEHRGVLTGAALTDVKICLIGGRASRQHTSGGDFRRAAYAAVRQGLMMAENILLEPVLALRLEVPAAQLGRALNDIRLMSGRAEPVQITEDTAVLEGTVPASELGDYAQTVSGYTGGRGRLSAALKGYEPCHNAREVMDRTAYDPDADRRNPTWSVFCSHGSGTVVPWDRVRDYMQVDTGWCAPASEGPFLTEDYYTFTGPKEELFELDRGEETDAGVHRARKQEPRDFREKQRAFAAGEEELQRIFERTYGPVKRQLRHPDNLRPGREESDREAGDGKPVSGNGEEASDESAAGGTSAAGGPGGENTGKGADGRNVGESGRRGKKTRKERPEEYLLVDGYNIIFAWEDLRELADADIGAARDKLLDILSDYAGYSGLTVIAVFDAYKVAGGKGQVLRWGNIDVVYTKEAETADLYIEKTAHRLSRNHRVTVATGDFVEQVIIFGAGALRMTPRGLLEAILFAQKEMRERFLD